MANDIKFRISYDIDKAGLNQLKSSLDRIIVNSQDSGNKLNEGFQKAASTARTLESILNKAYNSDLGTINVSKFNQELLKSNINIKDVKKQFESAGNAGATAFNILTSNILNTNIAIKQSNKLLDDMATSMSNTVKWGITSSIFNTISRSISSAVGYAEHLNRSLNDIRIVTDKSSASMEKFAKDANNAAKALGASTLDYTEASLIYYQQGLADAEVRARTETTLKAANITGQRAEQVSEQLTAVWNGYKVSAAETEAYVDKLAAVAASTASDLEELSTGMSKVASAAANMGVDVDQLNGILSTIIAVTRQAPESAGTAIKTIFARMQDLKLDGVDEYGVKLGEVSASLASMGVQIFDTKGELRDLGEVIEEVGDKWNADTWSEAEKQALAIELAGKRQYNNLLALFDNWQMYKDAVRTSADAVGTLQHQQDIYMESTSAKLQELRTTWQDLYDGLIDDKELNAGIEALTNLVQVFDNFIDSFGGGIKSITAFGVIVAGIFNKQISQAIINARINQEKYTKNMELLQQKANSIQIGTAALDKTKTITPEDYAFAKKAEEELKYAQRIYEFRGKISSEQYNYLTSLQKEIGELEFEATYAEKAAEEKARELKLEDELLKKALQRGINQAEELDAETALVEKYNEKLITQENVKKESDLTVLTIKRQLDAIDKGSNLERSRAKILVDIRKLYNSLLETDIDELRIDENKLIQSQEYFESLTNENSLGIEIINHREELIKKLNEALSLEAKITEETRNQAVAAKNVIQEKERANNIRSRKGNPDSSFGELEETLKNYKNLSDSILNVTSVLSGAVMAWSSLGSIIQTVSDDEASVGERITQVVMALSMAIPMLVNSWKRLNEVVNISNVLSTIFADKQMLTAVWSVKQYLAYQKEGTALEELTAEELINNFAKHNGIKFTEAQIAAIKFLIKAEDEDIATKTALEKIQLKVNAAFIAFPGLKFIAIIAAVVAAIGGLILIINKVNEAATKNRKEFERLSSEAEVLKSRYDELTESVNKFKQAISSYKNGIDELAKLKTGTEEYGEKLKEVNANARDLIETYKLFDSYSVENGVIQIDETAAMKAIEESARKAQRAYASTMIEASEAGVKASAERLGQKLVALRTTEWEPISTNIEVIEKIADAIKNFEDNAIDGQDVTAWKDAVNKEFNNKLSTTSLSIIEQYKAEFDNIAKEKTNNKNAIKYYNDIIQKSVVEDAVSEKIKDFTQNNSLLYNAIIERINKNTEQVYNLAKENDKIDTSKANIFTLRELIGDKKLSRSDIVDIFAKNVLNLDAAEIKSNGFGRSSYNIDGKDYSYNKIIKDVYRYEQGLKNEQNFKDKIENEFIDVIKNVVSATKEGNLANRYGHNFIDALQTGIANGGSFNFASAFKDIDLHNFEDIMSMSEEDWKKNLNINSFDEIGFESAQAFKEGIYNGFRGWTWNIDDALGNAVERYNEEIDLLGLSKKKTEEYKDEIIDYGKHLMRIATDNEEFSDGLEKNADAAIVVSNSIIRMNKGIDKLADGIEDWSDILNNSSKSSQEYGDAILGIANALGDLFNIEDQFISNDFILDHLEDIKKAANGSEDAISSLQDALSKDITENILTFNNKSNLIPTVESELQELQNLLDNYKVGEEIHLDMDTNGIVEKMNEIIQIAGLTADQANALFKTIGFEPNFETYTVEQTQTVPILRTRTWQDGSEDFTAKTPNGEIDWLSMPQMATITYQDGVQSISGQVQVPAVSSDKNKPPKVKFGTKTAPASASNYSSRNSGGKKPGKSSSGGSSKAKNEDKLKDQVDRYHDINLEIEKLNTSYSRLEKQQSKLFGKDLLKNLDQQLELLKQQQGAYKAKIALAREEQRELQAALALQGVTFGSDGYISNYAAIMNAKMNYLNDMIERYNAMSATEQEAFKETLDQAKKDYETFKTQLENYDKLISSTIPSLEDQIQDAIDKEIEINIKKFTAEVEVRLDMAKAERDFNEFKRKVIDKIKKDDILGNAESKLKDYISYFDTFNTGTGPIQKLTQQVVDTMSQIETINRGGWGSAYGDNKAQAMEDLKKYYEELRDQLEDIEDLTDEIKESYLDMIDKTIDAFDEQVDQYEYINDLINHDLNLIGLLYGDDAYAEMSKYYQEIERNNNQELDFLRQRVTYAEQIMKAETDPEAREKWQKEWENALKSLNSKVEDAVQNIIDKYKNSIKQVFDELNKNVTNGMGLDYVNEEWNLINKNADQYLDTINGMFAIQELENKYLDALDSTDSISGQKILNNLMNEQLEMLREKDKLTQYDVDRANLMYDIALKQIALQDAQQNKSKLRLRRDSQGNYTYQFVSDEDSIAQAQQDLAAAQNELYNLDKNKYKQNLNDIYDIYSEFQEKLLELYSDQTLAAEERAIKEQLYVEQYGELINGLVEQNEGIRTNLHDSALKALADMYNTDVDNFKSMSDKEISILMEELVPWWDTGIQSMADKFAAEPDGFVPVCKDAMDQLEDKTKEYQDSLDELQNVASIDFNLIASGIDENIYKTQELLYNNEELIQSYMNEINAILAVISQLQSLVLYYNAAQQAAIAATTAAYQFLQAQNAITGQSSNRSSDSSYGASGSGGTSSGSSLSGSGNGSGSKTSSTTANRNLIELDDPGNSPNNNRNLIELDDPGNSHGYVIKSGRNQAVLYSESGLSKQSAQLAASAKLLQLKKTAANWEPYIASVFDTGGYTGSWNSKDGKMAVLHEKELVLNKQDTSNILSAVGLVRDMAGLLSNIDISVNNRIGGLMSKFMGNAAGVGTASTVLDQNVHIDATFPNVRNSNEIEEAFNNLLNTASQYAYSQNR